MCFSAGASFGAGIILSSISVACIKKVKRPSQLAFASIPLIFAMQQFAEGFLWLSLTDSFYSPLQKVATYTFLFFAQIVWPVWVPASIMFVADKAKRKSLDKFLVIIGIIISLFLAYCLLTFHVQAKVSNYHIAYGQDYPAGLTRYGGIFYMIVTILPAFLSSVKRMWTVGTALAISYLTTIFFYTGYVLSVWCFFASIISVTVFVVMHKVNLSVNKAKILT